MWWVLLGLLGPFLEMFFQTFSKVYVIWIFGARLVEFRPWPHKLRGRWWFGRTMSYWYNFPQKHKYIFIAPLISSCFTAYVWLMLGHSDFLPLKILGLWSLISIVLWFKGYFFGDEHTGGYKWRHRKEKQ